MHGSEEGLNGLSFGLLSKGGSNMPDYIESLRESLDEEMDAGNKYTALAKEAPTENAKEQLLRMAKEEIMHRAMLQCLLVDAESGDMK